MKTLAGTRTNLGQTQGWEVVDLKSISDQIDYGYTASAVSRNTGTKFLRITDIAGGSIDWESVPYCMLNESEYGKYKLEAGDIVIARTGATVGHAKQIPARPGRAIFASYLIRVKIGPKAHKGYVGMLVESNIYKEYIKTIAGGAAQPNANAKDLTSFKLFLPPLPIQRKIAAILSTYDDLIENNNRRIAILEKMAEEIYREWFVRMRFPGHAKVKFHKGVPEGWEIRTIGQICTKVTDGSHFSPPLVEPGKRMASVKDMNEHGFSFDDMKTISEQDFEKLRVSDCMPLPNDVLIAKDGSYLKHVLVWNSEAELVILSSIAILRPDLKRVTPYFLSLTLRQDSTKSMMSGFVSGSALPRIILKDFKKMKVLIPPVKVMNQFESFVVPHYRTISLLLSKNERCRLSRDLLLSRLITGKLSVEDLDIKFPPSMLSPEPVEGREADA